MRLLQNRQFSKTDTDGSLFAFPVTVLLTLPRKTPRLPIFSLGKQASLPVLDGYFRWIVVRKTRRAVLLFVFH